MNKFKFLDLTHTLSPEIPSWDGSCGFEIEIAGDYTDFVGTDSFRTQTITMKAGMGTHVDAPAHCFPGKKTIDGLGTEELMSDCAVIRAEHADESFVFMPEAVEAYEEKHGRIGKGTFVIFESGWSIRWSEKEKYINDHKFPSVHEDTAKLLVERDISGLGVDTLSADTGAHGFPVHRTVLGAGKYLVENIANADKLPATGAKILVLPIKVKDGAEAPARVVGII